MASRSSDALRIGLKLAGVAIVAFIVNNVCLALFVLGGVLVEYLKSTDQSLYVLAVLLICIISVLIAYMAFRGFDRFVLHLKPLGDRSPISPLSILKWLAISLFLVTAVLNALSLVAHVQSEWIPAQLRWGVPLMIIVAFFPGTVEEMAYRWIFYRYARQHMPRIAAALLSGLLFGAIHLGQVASVGEGFLLMVAALAVTFLFISLYEWAGTLWAPIMAHWVWDMFFLNIGVSVTSNASHAGPAESVLGDLAFTQFLHLHYVFDNPILSGGSFGVDSSPVTILIYGAVAFLFWNAAARSKKTS